MYKLFILILASIIPFIFSLNGGFVFDDSEAITKNKDVTADSFHSAFYSDFWGTNIRSNVSHKSYRPLTTISFRLNYLLAGNTLNSLHFKITNLICHVTCTILVWYSYKVIIVGVKFPFKGPAKKPLWDVDFLAALLFGVHPVHTEAVSGIVGRADILSAITYFASFLLYHCAIVNDLLDKRRKWFYLIWSLTLALMSMLFKEIGITVLGFCLMYDLIMNLELRKWMTNLNNGKNVSKRKIKCPPQSNNSLPRILILLSCTLLFLFVRWSIMGKSVPQFKSIDNPAAFSNDLFTKIATYNYIYFLNSLLLFWPQWLCFDWSMGCIPIIEQLHDYRLIFILIFNFYILVSIYYICNSEVNSFMRRVVSLAFLAMVVPFLPASNIVVTVGFVIAERVLYIPSAGYCLLIAIGFNKTFRRLKMEKLGIMLYICLLSIYAMRSMQRSFDWQNEYMLFTSGLLVCPLNAKVHYNVAKVADARNLTEWSLEEYRKAISLYPEYYQAMNNLANLLKDQKKYIEAEMYLKTAISYKDDFPAAWMNLGIVYAATGRYSEAERAYLTAIQHRRRYPDCYYNLGNLYLDTKRSNEAISAWNKAIELNPKHILAWSNLLALLDNTGQMDKALVILPQVLNELPQTPSIHFVAANIFGKIGHYETAERHFHACIKLLGNRVQPIHHTNFGVLYHRWKKYELAAIQYNKALLIDPQFKSALGNIETLKKVYI